MTGLIRGLGARCRGNIVIGIGLVTASFQEASDRDVLVDVFPMQPEAADPTAARCLGVAFRRRGNQAQGTPIVRPSDKSTHIELSSKLTAVAEISIPSSLDSRPFFAHDPNEGVQLRRIKPEALGDDNLSTQPQFNFVVATTRVNMRRFTRVALIGKEKELIAVAGIIGER